jgi:DNA (cytosine-5)-methyltransferase 1
MQSTPDPCRAIETKTPTAIPLEQSIILQGTPMQKYGVPVGAVVLPGPCIQSFHEECRKAFPEVKSLGFRGVENHHGPTAKKIEGDAVEVNYKAIHVQTEVAASLLDGDAPSLVEFIHRHGGHFLPGVRMQKDKRRNPDFDQQKESSSKLSRVDAEFTFVELFAGVGGFHLGLEPIGGACVLASERDEVACAFYRRHFGSHRTAEGEDKNNLCSELVEGDIIDVVSDDFPKGGFDLLTAGFPCQPFSVRGKQKGLDEDGHRGQMYQELVRILMEQQPPFFLFENVVGLVTMDGGRRLGRGHSSDGDQHYFEAGKTMETVLKAFRSCGYKVEWHVVNCKYFCPQHRERVYFVGSLLELNTPDMVWDNIYPREEDIKSKLLIRDFLEQDYSTNADVARCELSEQQWEMVKRKCDEKNEDALTERGLKIDDPSAPTLISSYRTPSGVSTFFVTEEADGTLRHGDPLRPRFLTPKEFRRIMGFPNTFEVTSPMVSRIKKSGNSDGDDENENDGGVDGNVYKVLGNAVVPSVIEAIGREILRLMVEVKLKKTRTQETGN